ncbi:hypothetical protein ACFO25_18790 [Paenactinomyces guangxiensis]|uniref:Uncharacterized protein n=1 Tax=Paenactinomyces guangxiensis TaxID=1490290 RepID=A0A7W2A8S5_9BACL|nr:hypothetical protein [Paenactinomyces guangxiensis]MBA4494494.1 hypothetical protein [Paenactinomyces guangxiensis]MBH8591451.1 hypothetical protein [Paenactinomyces guangxiensis]
MKNWKNILMQTSLGTAVAINLMLGALILGRNVVPAEEAVPSIGGTAQPDLRVEYVMELAGSETVSDTSAGDTPQGKKGSWVVEHYKEYEYRFDKNGRLIDKRPTSKETHIRYWNGNH